MNSRLLVGRIDHARLSPARHAFSFPFFCVLLDLSEVERLGRKPFFGYNRPAPLALYDRDYLAGGVGSIQGRLREFLEREGMVEADRIELLTAPRLFGYAFNPVSFYFCYASNDQIACVVAEVNNTFGERHLYLLHRRLDTDHDCGAHYRIPKEFYVSPFNRVEGDYEFCFDDPRQRLRIEMKLWVDDAVVFRARWSGVRLSLDAGTLWRTVLRRPLNNLLTLPRIHWEAAQLYFKHKLALTAKPPPSHPHTIGARPPTVLHRLAMGAVLHFFSKIRRGRFTVVLPDGSAIVSGDASPSPAKEATLWVDNYDLFVRLLKDGDVGLGEGYTAGEYRCSSLTTMLSIFIDNRRELQDRRLWTTLVSRLVNRIGHLFRANTPQGSRHNIRAHYDMGDELFGLFLDPTMSYSCALFESPDQSLEDAQKSKINEMLRKARLGPTDHLLEIGCGWGSLAIEAARRTGCRVTAITLSENQLARARRRVLEAGLEDRVEVLLCDYRSVRGRYTRIVSVEMLEAVGHENFGQFFATCDRLLLPDGFLVLQVITVPDEHYETYRRGCDWIQKVIFPGGLCPSMSALSSAMARHSSFVLEHLENIGVHYAETLRRWRDRFMAAWPAIEETGRDERFRRTWEYYFSYCEAGFATRTLGTLQMVYTRPNNQSLRALERVR